MFKDKHFYKLERVAQIGQLKVYIFCCDYSFCKKEYRISELKFWMRTWAQYPS